MKYIKPGETKSITFKITPDDLILINSKKNKVVEPGEFKVMIGSSYEDIRLQKSFYVKSDKSISEKNKDKDEPLKMMFDLDQ